MKLIITVLFFKDVLGTPEALTASPILLNIGLFGTTFKSLCHLLLLRQTEQEVIMALHTHFAVLVLRGTIGRQIGHVHADVGLQDQDHLGGVLAGNALPVLAADATVVALEVLV